MRLTAAQIGIYALLTALVANLVYSQEQPSSQEKHASIRKRELASIDKLRELFAKTKDPDLALARIVVAPPGRQLVNTFAFEPSQNILAISGLEGTVLIDLNSEKEKATLSARAQFPESALCFSPDGKLLACGQKGSSLLVLDTKSGKEVVTLTGSCQNTGTTFSPDGASMVAVQASGDMAGPTYVVTSWETKSWQPKLLLEKTRGQPIAAVSQSGRFLACGLRDKSPGDIDIWDTTTCKHSRVSTGHANFSICFSGDEKLHVLSDKPKSDDVELWTINILTGKKTSRTLKGHVTNVIACAEGRYVLVRKWVNDGKVYTMLLDYDTLEPRWKMAAASQFATKISPGGVFMATNDFGQVTLWVIDDLLSPKEKK